MSDYTDFNWLNFKENLYIDDTHCLMLDFSRMCLPQDFWPAITPRIKQAMAEMRLLEGGALDEQGNMAGHFWLRAPELAPKPEIAADIKYTKTEISRLAGLVHSGALRGEDDALFSQLLVIGVGGSCQGTRYISRALSSQADHLRLFFLDNTDPCGMAELFVAIQPRLAQTLVAVVSKSGSTVETINGMLETQAFFKTQGLNFASHAISVSTAGSALDILALKDGWLTRLTVPDWISGRFSLCTAVGLLPLALQGVNIDAFTSAMAYMDAKTRQNCPNQNPAALLAGALYGLTKGQNHSQLVLLPYRDNLEYLPAYLQQLIMESIGKEYDRNGRRVCQGLTVYGHKGTSDQHSYLQQLLAGPDDFCAVFVEVLNSWQDTFCYLDGKSSAADDLEASLLATRRLLSAADRKSITITLPKTDAACLGYLVALWERSVGLYAAMLNLNAYDQPAVEQIKTELPALMLLKERLISCLAAKTGQVFTLEQIVEDLCFSADRESVFKWLRYLVSDPLSYIKLLPGENIWEDRYYYSP